MSPVNSDDARQPDVREDLAALRARAEQEAARTEAVLAEIARVEQELAAAASEAADPPRQVRGGPWH